jgi:hypothetical protein
MRHSWRWCSYAGVDRTAIHYVIRLCICNNIQQASFLLWLCPLESPGVVVPPISQIPRLQVVRFENRPVRAGKRRRSNIA